jgi:hypothetical protein
MTAWVMPAMIAGSPSPRCWWSGRNQFQQLSPLPFCQQGSSWLPGGSVAA